MFGPMSHYLEEHGGDPSGGEIRRNRENLASAGDGADAAYDNFFGGSGERRPTSNDPWQYTGLDRALYVEPHVNEDGEQDGEQFNQTWMRDHWQGRQGLGTSHDIMQARSSIGGGIGADLLRADRGHVFEDRLRPAATQQATPPPRPKKRGFFSKLWSAVRGRGWR